MDNILTQKGESSIFIINQIDVDKVCGRIVAQDI